MNVSQMIVQLQRLQYEGMGHLPVCVAVPRSGIFADVKYDELCLAPTTTMDRFTRTNPSKLTPLPLGEGPIVILE